MRKHAFCHVTRLTNRTLFLKAFPYHTGEHPISQNLTFGMESCINKPIPNLIPTKIIKLQLSLYMLMIIKYNFSRRNFLFIIIIEDENGNFSLGCLLFSLKFIFVYKDKLSCSTFY